MSSIRDEPPPRDENSPSHPASASRDYGVTAARRFCRGPNCRAAPGKLRCNPRGLICSSLRAYNMYRGELAMGLAAVLDLGFRLFFETS